MQYSAAARPPKGEITIRLCPEPSRLLDPGNGVVRRGT